MRRRKVSVLAISETRLIPDSSGSTSELVPAGYEFSHSPDLMSIFARCTNVDWLLRLVSPRQVEGYTHIWKTSCTVNRRVDKVIVQFYIVYCPPPSGQNDSRHSLFIR